MNTNNNTITNIIWVSVDPTLNFFRLGLSPFVKVVITPDIFKVRVSLSKSHLSITL